MKKVITILILCISFIGFAQDSEDSSKDSSKEINRWTFKAGVNVIDNSGDVQLFNAFNSLNENAFGGTPIVLGVEKRINNLFGFQLEGSFNTWEAPYGVIDGYKLVNDESYASLDASVKFYGNQLFENPLKLDWLDLYAIAGLGAFKINEVSPTFNYGAGAAVWISESVGLNFDIVGKKLLTSSDVKFTSSHVQYSFGVVFKLQKTNNKDEEEKGQTEEEMLSYYLLNNPDTDEDGVLDKVDKCINVVGPASNLGCPYLDTDKDGVIDAVDNCINIVGSTSNRGCPLPDRDNDGVIDRIDKCPDNPGSYRGCPQRGQNGSQITVAPTETKMIKFDSGKRDFVLEKEDALLSVVDFINKQPESSKFRIEGHTDSTGSNVANRLLSKERANIVRDYLVEQGIAAERLITVGLGGFRPIDTNLTKEGRSNNRRIEIVRVQ